jgi:hypothetical protein
LKLKLLEEVESRMAALTDMDRELAAQSLSPTTAGEKELAPLPDNLRDLYSVLHSFRVEGNEHYAKFQELHAAWEANGDHDDAACEALKGKLKRCEMWIELLQDLLYNEFRVLNDPEFSHPLIGLRSGWVVVWREHEELEQELVSNPESISGALKLAIERATGGTAEVLGEFVMDGVSAEVVATSLREKYTKKKQETPDKPM